MEDLRKQAVTGVIPPEVAEATIAIRWPSVTAYMGGKPAELGHAIQATAKRLLQGVMALPQFWLVCLLLVFVTPIAALIAMVAWALLAPFYFAKILPVLMTRYVLTNKRVMVQEGWQLKPGLQVNLQDIKEVRIVSGTEHPFYLSADLEFLFGEKGSMTLHGVKEYKTFKASVENAYLAWGRKDPPKEQKYSAADLAKAAK
jgi:hypothetical protein